MRVQSFTFLSALAAAAFVTVSHAAPIFNNKRATEFFPPKDGGGSNLGSFEPGALGEPLNVRIFVATTQPSSSDTAIIDHCLWSQ
jgi:hypothetical protein